MSRQGKKKEPGIVDVIHEVNKMDMLQKGTPEYEKAHKKVVNLIVECNHFYGQGWTSISKTRSLVKYMRRNDSGIYKPEKKDKKKKKELKND